MTHIIVYDDNATRRESLKILLESVGGYIVCGMFENCLHVEKHMKEFEPDIVLMDIQMPECDGIEGVKKISEFFPNVKIIMQTVFEDDDKIFDAIKYGASGYILKKTEPHRIIEAIKDVLNGGSPMTPSIATKLLSFFRSQSDHNQNNFGLSNREKEILNELVEGKSYKMVADKLSISYHTVNSHIKKIYDKLQVHSLGEAISKAIHQKIV